MKLDDYLKREHLTLEDFARKIHRSTATVSRLKRGINRPDWNTVEEIERATSGEVTANDFLAAQSDNAA